LIRSAEKDELLLLAVLLSPVALQDDGDEFDNEVCGSCSSNWRGDR
jgi:hypothetical protein